MKTTNPNATRNHRALCAVLAALLAASLTACGGQSKTAEAPSGESEAPAADGGQAAAAQGTELQMLVSPTIFFAPGAQTDDGYYYIEPNPEDYLTGQIRYIDYASAVNIPLSAQANSDHTEETDTAYLDSIIGDYRMFLWNDTLYFMREGDSYSIDNSSFGALAASAVYSMERDGSNRKLLYQGDSAGDLCMYAFGSADTLYLMRQTTDSYEVFSVPKSGGAGTVLASFPLDPYLAPVGCAGSSIYFAAWTVDESLTNEYGDPGVMKGELKALDVDSGAVSDVMSLYSEAEGNATPFVTRGTLYLYYPDGARRIDCCDLNGNVQSTIPLQDVMPDTAKPAAGNDPLLVGDTYTIPCYDTVTHNSFAVVVDLAAQTVGRSDLLLTQSDEKDDCSAQIMAVTPTEYLAITAINYVDAEMPLGDGTSTKVQSSRYTYELIPKDEFCAANPTVRTVERVD